MNPTTPKQRRTKQIRTPNVLESYGLVVVIGVVDAAEVVVELILVLWMGTEMNGRGFQYAVFAV